MVQFQFHVSTKNSIIFHVDASIKYKIIQFVQFHISSKSNNDLVSVLHFLKSGGDSVSHIFKTQQFHIYLKIITFQFNLHIYSNKY